MKMRYKKPVLTDLIQYLYKKYDKQIKFYLEGRWREKIEELINIGYKIDYKGSEILLIAQKR